MSSPAAPPPNEGSRRPLAIRLGTVILITVLTLTSCAGPDGAAPPDTTETDSAATDPTDAAPSTSTSTDPREDPGDAERAIDEPTTTGTTPAGGSAEPASCATGQGERQRFTSEAGGPAVDVLVYVPANAGDEALPVVLNWHGLGSNGAQQVLLSAYEDLAETEGFIAVHPTGASAPGSNRNSWELAQFDVPGRDDLAMVDDLIDRLVDDYCADPARIYSTGLSNGGFFTALLVCERADRIAAAVSVAGVSHPDGCQPSRPVPFAAFHGTADEVVLFDGGRSTLEAGAPSEFTRDFFDQSMPEEFAQFAAAFGCSSEPEAVMIGDEVTRNDYVGCDDDVPLSFYEVADGGHTWPGSPLGPLLTSALGRTTDEVSATADGWAFMSRFSLPDAGQETG